MPVSKSACLVAATALSGVSGLQIPLQLHVPKLTWSPWEPSSSASHDLADLPLIDTKVLQDSIKAENLEIKAKDLYQIAKSSEEEYNHPTRVIGSQGESSSTTHCFSS